MIVKIPFLKKWQTKEVVALDWGSHEMKWAKLKAVEENRFALVYLDSLPIPQEGGAFWTQLKEYVSSHQLLHHAVAVSWQDEHLYYRHLELPRMPKEDLMEAIRWQMRDIAESLDDYTIQYSILEEKTMGDLSRLVLLGFAIKTELVQKKLSLLERAGLHPFFVEPTPVAMAATLDRIYPTAEGRWIGCADLGPSYPYFLVLGHGKLHFIRHLPGLMIENNRAEEYASKLSVELQSALDAFFITHRTERMDRIFLAGGGASVPNLPALLSTNLGIAVEQLNPLQKLAGVETFAMAKERPYLFGPVLAEALLKP